VFTSNSSRLSFGIAPFISAKLLLSAIEGHFEAEYGSRIALIAQRVFHTVGEVSYVNIYGNIDTLVS
jgi:hypothetical protein